MKYGAGRKDVIGKVPPLAAGDRQKHHPKQSRQGARSIRSLVVDDDSTILKCVTFMLSLLGFEKVDTAQREIEAMSKLAAGRPYDLLVTDLEMPDMNGYDLSQMIKTETHDTKVIIMTGRHPDDCLEMMMERWVDGWLFKPFGLKELHAMLQRVGL